MSTTDALMADAIVWDLEGLVQSPDVSHAIALVEQADALAEAFGRHRGTVGTLDGAALAVAMHELHEIAILLERANVAVFLDHTVKQADPAAGQRMATVTEKATIVGTKLVFFDLEWALLDDKRADELLQHPDLHFCRHYLKVQRANRPHLLSENEEKVLAEKSVTGVNAWTRLFDEQLSDLEVDVKGEMVPFESALSNLGGRDAGLRKDVAAGITKALEPGLRTRAYIYNTILADRSIDDRLRTFATWSSNRNLSNQASDASVKALVAAVSARNDIPQRWYRLKAKLMGVDQLKFYDRNAALDFGDDELLPWSDAKAIVSRAYHSFSPTLGNAADEFFTNPWIHAPASTGKRGGAFCAPTVPQLNPYLMVNYNGRRTDVLTLAHEMGHGIHFLFSGQHQSLFEMSVPLTVAETASIFGEALTFNDLLETTTDPAQRLGLLASNVDSHVATIFRQVAMYRFEDLCHEQRRRDGELSVAQINGHWMATQNELFGGTVDATGYETWWSYVSHFIHVPGYVYAYAFGNLLALSVFERAQLVGPSFEPNYLDMLRSGGSKSPEALAQMVGCDLNDPEFWNAGLALVDRTLAQAEEAAAIVASAK
jgi:oligoendopeptidase F